MNTNLLDTKTLTLNEILGNGKIYRVPQFQRDYSWEEENWEDLWNDILNTYTAKEAHYMGSIVLQIKGDERDKEFWIIDGQQRFTTLSILTLALIHKIKDLAKQGIDPEQNNERVELLLKQYIGQKDPASLLYSSKLFLNETDDSFYQRLLNFKEPLNPNKLKSSEKLIWSAFLFFKDKIETQFIEEKNGELISSFLTKTVAEQLKFIQITVVDELNAYTVFETLNSRRVELTSTDLLKNYLFSLVAKSETDLKVVKNQWKKIVEAIGLKKFPTFLLAFLNGNSSLVTEDKLFKAIKSKVQLESDVLNILDQLESYAYIYNALSNSEDELWNGDKEIKENIQTLNLFQVTQCYSLLMVSMDKLEKAEFKKILRAIVTISFRYNVIVKVQTKLMEKVYNFVANKISSGEFQKSNEIISNLKGIYISDEMFKTYFELKSLNTENSQQKKIVRYILYKIESQMENGIKTSFDLDDGTIEHILPENMDEHWSSLFSEEDHSNCIYSLGNLTLLEPIKNSKDAARLSFQKKLPVYNTSRFAITKEIKGNEWSVKMIKHRQANLAKIASGIWKI